MKPMTFEEFKSTRKFTASLADVLKDDGVARCGFTYEGDLFVELVDHDADTNGERNLGAFALILCNEVWQSHYLDHLEMRLYLYGASEDVFEADEDSVGACEHRVANLEEIFAQFC